MKLITFLLAILLPLLVACSWIGGDGPKDCAFANPYLPDPSSLPDKVTEFGNYKAPIRNLSEASELKQSTLKSSIKENLTSPYGTRFQLYNYVVTVNCDFLAATWTGSNDLSDLQADSNLCLVDPLKIAVGNKADTMINFFPEDLGSQLVEVNAGARRSPCWFSKGEKPKGLLDALSKHFMLAQGEESRIADFFHQENQAQRKIRQGWSTQTVAYAGEILVDLTSCTYSLNSNSGTYKPLDIHMAKVSKLFASKVNGNSMKISGVKPWC